MTLQTIPGGLWLPSPPVGLSAGPSNATSVLDAVNEEFAFVVQCPKAGEVSGIGVSLGPVSDSGHEVEARLETLDAAGLPSGTLKDTNANEAGIVLDTGDDYIWLEATFTASATVGLGDFVAGVYKMTTRGGTGSVSFHTFSDEQTCQFPYTCWNTGGGWVKRTMAYKPTGVLIYDDASYAVSPRSYPSITITTTAFNNTDDPDRIGNRFQLAAPARVAGAWFYGKPQAAADFDIVLYDSDGTSVLGTISVDGGYAGQDNASGIMEYLFSTPATLAKDTTYYLAIEPSTANDVTVYDFTVNATAILNALFGGDVTVYKATKKDAAWTETNTKRMMLGLIIDQVDDGVGGGALAFIETRRNTLIGR